jgi:mediator of RNA polymerase II transcription subunit 14
MSSMNQQLMHSSVVPVMNMSSNQFQNTAMVSLGRLIDFSIQRTYHELTVLADLLPRKTDLERKIEIVSFASRTRQLFVRLLALVKWAGSASKVEKCASIVSFLDKQSMLFTETADILAKMSRETLVQARLPCFQLPAAVDVLNLGTYSRLPSCIRDRIVPPDPITSSDRRATLLRLNHIIQQRLVSTSLPSQMRNLKIEFGRVTFHVDHEFELSLTLLGDIPSIPWKVLNIEILVEDKETGGGKDLVHHLQIMFLQHLVQSRLTDNLRPLIDAYNTLHSFCLSLQLEVLHAQAIRLCQERLEDFIRIDEYSPGNRLLLSYWREHPRDDKIGYKLCVEIDSAEPSRPLQVSHYPELGTKEALQTYQAIKSDYLSIEKVLIHTTYERAKQKLIQLKKEFEEKDVGECLLSGSPAVLQVSFLQPCMTSERLLISVDTLTGHFLVHIPQFDECSFVDEIQAVINRNFTKAVPLFLQLRIWLTRERCKKTVESLPVFVMESLPFPTSYSHPFLSIKSPKLYYQFSKHHQNYLVTVFSESDSQTDITIDYYLIYVSQTSIGSADSSQQFEVELPKPYLQITKVLKLDVSNILHHPYSSEDVCDINGKRKMSSNQSETSKLQRKSATGYYIPELAHVVSFCEEKLAYSSLSNELQKRSICHQVLQDSDGYTHVIDIVKFPNCLWCPESYTNNLQADTLSCTIRLQGKGSKIWNVVIAFCNPPLQTQALKEHGSRRIVNIAYDYANGSLTQITKMVDELLSDWTAIARLYDVIKNFANSLQLNNQINSSLMDIKSFSYKKLVLGYGNNKNYTVRTYFSINKLFSIYSQTFI